MMENRAGIISGAVAAAVFLILLFGFRGGIILSVLTGAVTYCLFAFVILRKKRIRIVAEGVTQDDVDAVLAEGRTKLKALEEASGKIADIPMKKKVRDIVTVAASIYADIEKEPKNVKEARKFITYYMDTAHYIVQRYIDLSADTDYIANGDEMTAKISSALDSLNQIFKKLKSKLLEDDLFELDTEIKLLEQTIKSEGI